MTFIHISNRWAIITMRSSAPPHSILVPLLASAFHEFGNTVAKPRERDACPSLASDHYAPYGACIVLVWGHIMFTYTKTVSPYKEDRKLQNG